VSTNNRKPIKFEKGSGNVFADLGLKDSDQLLARSQIGFHVFKILEGRKLKQREIAGILGIAQPDVSHLMNGHFSRFTTDKLLDFLKRLDQKVTIEVSRHHKGEPYQGHFCAVAFDKRSSRIAVAFMQSRAFANAALTAISLGSKNERSCFESACSASRAASGMRRITLMPRRGHNIAVNVFV
jgi:predicted XRE-type DNA-binding protein